MANCTVNENTRNDRYAIMKKGDTCANVISYGENFIGYINSHKLLSEPVDNSYFENDFLFRELVSKLDQAGYYVFQLTRL